MKITFESDYIYVLHDLSNQYIAGRQGGRACISTGGQRAGRCDSSFHSEAEVSRDGELDLADEA